MEIWRGVFSQEKPDGESFGRGLVLGGMGR